MVGYRIVCSIGLLFVCCLIHVLIAQVAFANGQPRQPDSLVAELLSIESSTEGEVDKIALESQLTDFVRDQRSHWNQVSSAAWAGIESRAGWETFREEKLARLVDSLGQFPSPPSQLNVQITGRVEKISDGFVIENLVYESRPGLWVSANLYKPIYRADKVSADKVSGILLCHSHHT
ncbi:MAG: hypothetical protein ABL921_11380, partial [Pirellula sp.]